MAPTTRNVEAVLVSIVNLLTDEETALRNASITTQDDLSYIKFEDLPGVISVVKRRKLSLIGEYLNLGGPALVATTTIQEVKDFVKDKSKRTGSTAPANADSAGGGLKVHTNPLKEFSGDPVEYEDWEKEALGHIDKQYISLLWIEQRILTSQMR